VGHHVVEVAEGGSDDPENVWTICEPCHLVIHALRRLAGGA
jgi:5-methylcytosine-specific restriction endonuclease McrA